MSVVILSCAQARRLARVALVAAVLPAFTAAAWAQMLAGPGDFLRDLSGRAIAQLSEPSVSPEEKERRFRALLNEGFDLETIGRFVIGRYWRGASEAERQAFLATFEDMIVHRFLPLFADHAGERLEVQLVRPFANQENHFSVTTSVQFQERQEVQVDWHVHKTDDEFKILDVVAEGVSVAVTLRAEYGSVLKRNGGDVGDLTRQLQEKIAAF